MLLNLKREYIFLLLMVIHMYNQSYNACSRCYNINDEFAIYQDRSSLDSGRCLLCNLNKVTSKIRESWQICMPKVEYARHFYKYNIMDVNWLSSRHDNKISCISDSSCNDAIDESIDYILYSHQQNMDTRIHLRQNIWQKR